MTRYLLDRDVMSQLDQPEADRHANVSAWFASVPDNDLFVSAITIMEAWRGLAIVRRRAARDPEKLGSCDRYEAAFQTLVSTMAGRILAIDEPVAKLWGTLLGAQDKNRNDACVAATASIHGIVVATRNTSDFLGRGAPTINPFNNKREILSA